MFLKFYFFVSGALFSLALTGKNLQFTPPKPEPKPVLNVQQPRQSQPAYDYKRINTNLQYAFIQNKPTSPNPKEGDQISVNMQMICNNKLLFNSTQAFRGKPATYSVNKSGFKGDIIEAILLMTPGDSVVCLVDADALFKNTKSKKPAFIKPGDKVQYFIKLLSIKTKEQLQKEQQAAFTKQINEQMAKQKAVTEKQMAKDHKEMNAWFAKNNLSPLKTPSGLYYSIKEEGRGEVPIPGDSITMNYTGTLLDGTRFDSNEDTAFHHVQPFKFVLGRGQVINGWDQGVALLKVGSKATFYIPSPLAYGTQVRPGSGANPKGIPANSILMFDVQLLNSKHVIPVIPSSLKKDSLTNPSPQIQKNKR